MTNIVASAVQKLSKLLKRLRPRPRKIKLKWTGFYSYKVHPPRKKLRSWSQRFYEISNRGKPRVTYQITPEGMSVMHGWQRCMDRSTRLTNDGRS